MFSPGVRSWTYPATYVSVTSGGFDVTQMTKNDAWEVTSTSVSSDDTKVSGLNYRYV